MKKVVKKTMPSKQSKPSRPSKQPKRNGEETIPQGLKSFNVKPPYPRPKALTIGTAADGRRMPAETEAVARYLASFVQKAPGIRMEQISGALGMKTESLQNAMTWAIKRRLVKRTGVRRMTSYFPASRRA